MSDSADIFHRIGALTLASRLRRLSDKLMQGVGQVYEENQLSFEPRWFPVFFLLSEESPLSITELAQQLGLTHPAINQVAEQLLAHELVVAERGQDKRKRLLALSPKGKELFNQLRPLWKDIELANRTFLSEAGGDLLSILDRLEVALERKDMYQRVMEIHSNGNGSIHIRKFTPADREHFKTLNYEWLHQYFKAEPRDEELLSNPDTHILDKGGAIFMAEQEGKVVGTCALLMHTPSSYEIVKLAVTEKMRGRKIGRKLTEIVIQEAKDRGATEVTLETNPVLEAAMHLYKSFGFTLAEDRHHSSEYSRPTILMKLEL